MKKTAFTLAEILISLMILGVIASLTIPSLIQNTSKKEQIVQLKKGLSMINQAVTMNYALTGNDLTNYSSAGAVAIMLKKRLSVVDSSTDSDSATTAWVRTQDGLTYIIGGRVAPSGNGCGGTDQPVAGTAGNDAGAGACYGIVISTKNASEIIKDFTNTESITYTTASGKTPTSGSTNVITGYYQFYAGADRVVPTANTQAIMNATDATKATMTSSST